MMMAKTLTTRQFKRKSERLFLEANPSAVITGWLDKPRRFRGRNGGKHIVGHFHAVAEGYRPRVLLADWDDKFGLMVR